MKGVSLGCKSIAGTREEHAGGGCMHAVARCETAAAVRPPCGAVLRKAKGTECGAVRHTSH